MKTEENKVMDTIVRQFKVGLELQGVVYKEFEMRRASLADMLEVEKVCPVSQPMTFNAHMATIQLVRVGDFNGVITMNMLKKLCPVDWWLLRDAQEELERLGEDE